MANTYQEALASRQTQLGAAESALGTANTLQSSPYGTPLVNPATGQVISGGQNVSPSGTGAQGAIQPNDPAYSALQQYAQLAASGQVSAIPSAWTSNPVINAQINSMAQQINPSYSPITSAAQGQATASNVTTGGTSDTQTAASGYATTLPAYQSASTAFNTADQQAGNLLNTLQETGINSSNATDYNTTINNLASKLGSTQTTAFTTALVEAQQSYTNLLASVGASTPTVNGEQATSVLNPSSTPAQIAQAIDKLNQAAYAKLAPQYQQALTYYNQLHGTTASAIPGYPPPTLPTSVSANAPQGPDTSAGNIGQAGIGALDVGTASLGTGLSAFAKNVLGIF